ncbi:MAG: hypothetical protein EOO43_12890 [Flavobacterium sp.]|nr:MAG: hypothetical protein EOO43_12890 [Flavobacterium sp.]
MKLALLLLLAIQVNAQQPQSNPQPIVTLKSNIISHVTTHVVATPEIDVILDTKQSSTVQEQEPQKTKTFTKTYAVDKNDKINLANEYGALIIKTWDKNEIKVDAEIKAFANSDSEAQKLLEATSINASKAGDLISFVTDIDLTNNWSSKSKKREVKVFMTVYMPSTNALNATQEYGDLVISDHSGPTTLAVEYGNLIAGNLKSSTNSIRVEYGKATIKSVNQARITHEYGDGITIGSAGSLSINAEYTTIKIGSLRGKATANLEYVKLIADDISASFAITADYGSITLGFDPSFKASINVATNYGSFKYGPAANVKRLNSSDRDYDFSRVYTGDIGKGDGKGDNISIKSEYTTIIFK